MSTSAAATTEPGPCPCGLTYEALDRRNFLTPVTALCTALGADGNPCNRRWADHPREGATGGGSSTDLAEEQPLKKQRREECIVRVRCLKREVDDVTGETLEIDGVPAAILVRYFMAHKISVYCRRCYSSLYAYIKGVMLNRNLIRPAILVSGVPGIGKSLFSIYFMIRMMLDNEFPVKECVFEFQRGVYSRFKLIDSKVTTAVETDPQVAWTAELTLETENRSEVDALTDFVMSDLIAMEEPFVFGRWTCIFSSPNPRRYKEAMKAPHNFHLTMPTWSEEELQFVNGNIDEWYERFVTFGGVPRIVLSKYGAGTDPFTKLQNAYDAKGPIMVEYFFKYGAGGLDDEISYMLVHINPPRNTENDDWDYLSATVRTFASDEIFRTLSNMFQASLLSLSASYLNGGVASEIYGGGTAGNLFEKVILWLKPIAGQNVTLTPLTVGSTELTLTLPTYTLLPRNWKSSTNSDKLMPNVLYQPRVSNLESGDCFGIIEHNDELVLVVLQITVGKKHPIKANGLKVIVQAYPLHVQNALRKKVLLFVTPMDGALERPQPLHTRDGKVMTQIPREVEGFEQYVCKYQI